MVLGLELWGGRRGRGGVEEEMVERGGVEMVSERRHGE